MKERAMYMHIRLLAIAVSLFTIAPATFANDKAKRSAIETAAQSWAKAFTARNADAMVALATDDVVLLDARIPPVSGREGARNAWRGAARRSGGQLTTTTKETEIVEDVAWRIAALAYKLPSGEVVNHGQALEIWKQVDGEWKLHRQMSSLLSSSTIVRKPLPSEPVLDKD
jgi:ketosteroid isomerase-like protein